MEIFKRLEEYGYEQLVYFYDKTTGLKGITCIHDTRLGPALGGTRLWNYASEDEAANDVIRLARGMSYKSAAAGLNLGGGKTVLIGDPAKVKSEAYFRALGRFVQSLNGRYITAEDVNTNTQDMAYVAMETNYVTGLEGKSGNPSPVTAKGVFHGVRATLKYAYGSDDISKYTFAVQGAGQTGYFLINYLLEAGAKKIYFTEINPAHIERMKKEHPEVEYVAPEKIFSMDVDVFCPCALGAQLNAETIPQIKAKAVAGSANNALREEVSDGKLLIERGITYAPDFVINAAGVINVYHEIHGYDREVVMKETEKIYDRLLEIFDMAKAQNISTQKAATIYAENRMATIGQVRQNYIPR